MFPKFQKPRLPIMGEQMVEKSDFKPVRRQANVQGGGKVGYPGGKANYPGKFEKPRMGKPHKRF